MSGLISGAVWGLALPRVERDVLLAMADHADQNGENVRPSLALVAWKTDYSTRQVQRIQKILRDKGILIVMRESRRHGRPTEYRIDLDAAPKKPPAPRNKYPGRPRSGTEKPHDISGGQSRKPHDISGGVPENPTTPMGVVLTSSVERHRRTPLPPADAGAHVDGSAGGGAGEANPTRTTKALREAQAIRDVLADWNAVTGRRRTYGPQTDAWKCIRRLLAAGYTREQLRLAAMGAWASPWHRGKNDKGPNGTGKDYTFPENIYRDSGKVDNHIRTARSCLPPEPWWPADEDAQTPAPRQNTGRPAYPGQNTTMMSARDHTYYELAQKQKAEERQRLREAGLPVPGEIPLDLLLARK